MNSINKSLFKIPTHVVPIIPVLGRVRQEDCCAFEVNQGYISKFKVNLHYKSDS